MTVPPCSLSGELRPPLKHGWINKKRRDDRCVLPDRVSRLCLNTLTVSPAPKSILAVRPLDQLTSSHPATHTRARSHSLSLRQTRALLVTYIVQFEVKAAGVAHRVPVPVAPPQGGGGGLAVCAAGARTSRSGLKGSRRGKYIMNNDPFTCCAREVRAGTAPRKKNKKNPQ